MRNNNDFRVKDNISDIIEDIWELGPEPNKDWFHH